MGINDCLQQACAKTTADAEQTALDRVATGEDRLATETFWNNIDNEVTAPMISMATELIKLQTIVAEHHAFA